MFCVLSKLYFMIYFSLFVFAVLPSFLWLLYFLKKDVHPEPKRLIFYVFATGALFAVIGYFFQRATASLLLSFFENIPLLIMFAPFFYKFVVVAFSEELLKYLAFFFTVRNHTELDEPIDIIIYMITAALGFAALENFIILSSLDLSLQEMAKLSVIRFFSGTFLHVLASGILGGFLAFYYYYNKKTILIWGVVLVSFLHGIYNLLAERIDQTPFFFLLLFFLFLLATALTLLIKKTKKMKSICK